MDIQFPLKEIDQNKGKTAEHWFNHYSVEINKIGYDKIPLLNRDNINKSQLIRFRGIVSNQLNNEFFNKICQFRELDDVKQPELNNDNLNDKDILQRYPMIITIDPNPTEWNKSKIYGDKTKNENEKEIKSVIAKFYCHTKSLKICDSVEIYGIWSPKNEEDSKEIEPDKQQENGYICPVVSNDKEKNDKENAAQQMKDLYLSPSNGYNKLPTIHVLYWKKIVWANPSISMLPNNAKNDLNKLFKFYFENCSLIRSSLIKYISKNYTFNDHLMAEYILLNMISTIVSNKNGILIGHFPLNIRGQFDNYKIRELYQLLTPYSLNINLNIKYLNAKRFVPIKNNETDELEIGILQIRDSTSIVIDETLLLPGNLNKIGLLNVEALKTLINQQKVFYDFQFHSIPFDTNCSIIILSKGRPLPQLRTQCFIYADCDKREENKNQDNDQDDNDDDEFTLDEYRMYLSVCRHLMDKFALNSEKVCKAIEQDFVDIRKKDKDANEDTLHHRLLMMRLINSSFLNQTEDNDMMNILKYMQMMEMKRTKRNEKFIPINIKNTKGSKLNAIAEE